VTHKPTDITAAIRNLLCRFPDITVDQFQTARDVWIAERARSDRRYREEAAWAAIKADRRFKKHRNGSAFWTGRGQPPTVDERIEWLQVKRPAKVRQIEAEIDKVVEIARYRLRH
jgi:hypothetical protein